MAELSIFVPDGEFCADKTHLGCVYERHTDGFHQCSLFDKSIGKLQDFTVNGEKRRAFKKCQQCLDALKNEGNDGFIPDRESYVARLVNFYKNYDFYDYQDSLEVGDTDEDAIKRMEVDLTNPENRVSLLAQLKELSSNANLSSEQKTELSFLIENIDCLRKEMESADNV